MKTNLNIEIGNVETKEQIDCDHLSIQLHIKQNQLKKINQKLQNILKLKKTPFFTIVLPQHEQLKEPIHLLKQTFNINDCHSINNNIYYYGQLSAKKMELLRKFQKVFHLLTASDKNQINLNFEFQGIQQWMDLQTDQKTIINLLNKVKINGNAMIEQGTLQTFKKIVNKISPQFMQSPIMAFFEIFQLFDASLKLQNLNFLEQNTQDQLSKIYKYQDNQNDEAIKFLMKKESKEDIVLYFTLQKLLSLEIKGSARLIGLLLNIKGKK